MSNPNRSLHTIRKQDTLRHGKQFYTEFADHHHVYCQHVLLGGYAYSEAQQPLCKFHHLPPLFILEYTYRVCRIDATRSNTKVDCVGGSLWLYDACLRVHAGRGSMYACD